VFGNKIHFSLQLRHLHYTDVMLYHVWCGLGLGLRLACQGLDLSL